MKKNRGIKKKNRFQLEKFGSMFPRGLYSQVFLLQVAWNNQDCRIFRSLLSFLFFYFLGFLLWEAVAEFG
jgi:hypothetical protein